MDTPQSNLQEPQLDRARQEKAKAFSRARRYFGIGDRVLGCAVLLFLLFSGFSVKLAGLFDLPVVARAVVYLVVLVLGYMVLASPLSYYGGFVLSRRYGISTQSLSGWLIDQMKARLLSLLLGAGIVALLYWFMSDFPRVWWALVWAALMLISVFMSVIAPVAIVPLFFKMRPLAEGDVKTRLEQLAARAGARVRGIFVIEFSAKMTAANAAVLGMGNTRRIVLSDTLLSTYSPEEIETVMAHELGHHRHGDIFRLFVFQGGLVLVVSYLVSLVLSFGAAALGFNGISDVSAFPLLMLIFGVFSLVSAPLMNIFSRYIESQADWYALGLTDNPGAFISAMTRLTDQNLSVAKPPRWKEVLLYDHPSHSQRVAHARAYLRRKANL